MSTEDLSGENQGDEKLKAENLEQFYNDMVIALREDLLKASGMVRRPRSNITKEMLDQAGISIPPQGMWISRSPRSPELRALVQSLPEPSPPYAGFQLIDVVRLGHFVLIGFSWSETAEQTYVYIVDLYPFATNYDVHTTTVIIATNLLERLGGQWYLHQPLAEINGLAFMEAATAP